MTKLIALLVLSGAAFSVVAFVNAQEAPGACLDPITVYSQVKNTCIGGHMYAYYDDNKCLTYKCVLNSESSSSSSSSTTNGGGCASLAVPNAIVKLGCTRTGGTIDESHDANGCLVLSCATKPPPPPKLQCVKDGCTLTCDDGKAYNVCPICASSSSSSSKRPVCTRTPSGRCTLVRCGTAPAQRICP